MRAARFVPPRLPPAREAAGPKPIVSLAANVFERFTHRIWERTSGLGVARHLSFFQNRSIAFRGGLDGIIIRSPFSDPCLDLRGQKR